MYSAIGQRVASGLVAFENIGRIIKSVKRVEKCIEKFVVGVQFKHILLR